VAALRRGRPDRHSVGVPDALVSRGRRRTLVVVLAAALAVGGCSTSPGVTWTSPSAGPTGAGPEPSATSAPADTITIVGSGDILLHPPLWDQARADARAAGQSGYDFSPLLAGVQDVVSTADLAICHLETPVAAASGPFQGFPRFSVPPQIAVDLAENGYDACSTASNHTIDQGEAGVDRTLDALDAAGIRHAGSYGTRAEQAEPTILDVSGVKVASLSYTFSFNGLRRPAGKEWIANHLDPDEVLAEAARARAEGAEIVIVSIHFGTEYQHSPNAQQVSVARKLLGSPDVDLILGHHAHVVQAFEKIGDKWIAYGMGNKVAHHAQPVNANREGVIARFTFSRTAAGAWQVTTAEAIPIWMSLSPDRLIDISAALDDPSTGAGDRATLQAAWKRIRQHLISRGADEDGLHIAGS
jgi:poly-gamma-glutamate synthesis protein (capsule biosynthesis protein)